MKKIILITILVLLLFTNTTQAAPNNHYTKLRWIVDNCATWGVDSIGRNYAVFAVERFRFVYLELENSRQTIHVTLDLTLVAFYLDSELWYEVNNAYVPYINRLYHDCKL